MANTLPAPTEGLVYTNPTTGKRMKYSDGCWKSIDYLPLDASDSMQGTLWTPDQLINGNTLTADSGSRYWAATPTPGRINANALTYSEEKGLFVAVGDDNKSMYSTDGINWTNVTIPDPKVDWGAIAYGNGRFVIGAKTGNYADRVIRYSEDAITWIEGDPTDQAYAYWAGMTYSEEKGLFVAVSPYRICYSSDGRNWAQAHGNEGVYWNSVTYGDGKFVAVATYLVDESKSRSWYSEDGINWLPGQVDYPASTYRWASVAYGDGRFVAVSHHGNPGNYSDKYKRVMTSEDGIIWTLQNTPYLNSRWTTVIYAEGMFLAVSMDADANNPQVNLRVMTSKDGVNDWTLEKSEPANGTWESVAYGDGRFVAVGTSIMYSINENDLYFNGDPVVVDTGTTRSLATLLSTQSTKLGRTKYYQDSALPSGDSYDYPDGSLWYQPTSNKLNFYNDSDQTWVQL